VVELTGTLDELRHSYNEFNYSISYGSRLEPRSSLYLAVQTSHILQTIQDKNEWPLYVGFKNIDSMIRSNLSNLATILVALLHIRPQYSCKGQGKPTPVREE
jgi:hypothetical protein